MNVESLVEQLFDPDADTRAGAAEQLCQIPDQLGPAADALLDVCQDEDERVREWAAAALESIETPSPRIAPLLTQRLTADNGLVAYWAATLLGRLGTAAANAAPPLGELVAREDADRAARERAAWALGRIGPPAAAAIQSLEAAAKSQHERLATLAKTALQSVRAA